LGNPSVKHCQLLIKNPRGCNGCPINPYDKPGGRGLRMLAEDPMPVDEALLMERQFSMGLIPATELQPNTAEIIRITQDEIRRLERYEQAKMIGREVAEILSKMFGKQ
jgi:hypothetical protein